MSSLIYDECVERLEDFYKSLPHTNKLFLFFMATDMTKPLIRNVMSSYSYSGVTYYIIQGNTKQYYHIYKDSDIKYIITSYKSNPARPYILYDVVIESRHSKGSVNHGDHIDFGIIRRRSPVVIKTHHTQYNVDLTKNIFSRDAPECNFVLRKENMIDHSMFINQKCEDKNGKPITDALTIATIYPNREDQNII